MKGFAQITIMGQIKQAPDSTEVLITYWNNPVENVAMVIGNGLVDEAGYFSYTYNLKEKQFGQFIVGEYYLDFYFSPGDTIIVDAEYHDYWNTIKFKSKVKAELDYLLEHDKTGLQYKFKTLSEYPNAFVYKNSVDSIEIQALDLYFKHLKNFKDPYFIDLARQEIKYIYMYKRFYFGINDFQSEIPISYYTFNDSLDISSKKLLVCSRYKNCLQAYLHTKCRRSAGNLYSKYENSLKDKKELLLFQYNFIKTSYQLDARDYMLSDFIRNYLYDVKEDTAFINKMLIDYDKECNNLVYKKYIKDFYNKRKNITNTTIPNFELKNIYNEKITLHSLKGKYIYIDFWATWCYPCRLSMKDYPALQQKYGLRKDIEYVFINVMDDEQKWSEFILNNPKYGLQLFADKNTSKKISDYFELNAIPRYLLIDKNLKILDVDAAFPNKIEIPE
jgi:thiol-disulfide isomerase/thioredoxin